MSNIGITEKLNEAVNAGIRPDLGKSRIQKIFRKQWPLYLMVLPGVIFFILFKYIPMFGSVIAFQNYKISRGILASEWVGLKHFLHFFSYYDLQRILGNSLVIASQDILFVFPAPILLALLFNEVKNKHFKKVVQTVSYLPHFFSWVIIAGLVFEILSAKGLVNSIRGLFGHDYVLYMQKATYFRTIIVISSIWKGVGWGSIVLLAAISNINPEYYEAAIVDGAGKLKQILHITLPLLLPTIVILFLLRIGHFLDLSFDQIFNLLTPMTYRVGDVLDTYVYRIGILDGQYSLTTAIGFSKSVIGLILIVTGNTLSRKYLEGGLW